MVFAPNVVATFTVCETVAVPSAPEFALPADEAVATPVACLVNAAASPRIGWPVAVSVRVAVTGVAALVHTEAVSTSSAD